MANLDMAIERVCSLVCEYTGAEIVNGGYKVSPIKGQVQESNFLRLDFDRPLDINPKLIERETGYYVELSDNGYSLTFRVNTNGRSD